MRTRLFFAFFAVIAVALVSNLLYERLMVRDFEGYVRGTRQDKLYWIMASVEGAYADKKWDMRELHDAAHWALMLGFDIKVFDGSGKELISSAHVMKMLSPSMKRRMQGIPEFEPASADEYDEYPLYIGGEEIGGMHVRELGSPDAVSEKEAVFKRKGREFLLTSFIIAGGGALLLAVLFSLYLSRPLNRMKSAVEALARGDFSARVKSDTRDDEIGRLSESFNYMAEALEREEALRKRLTSNIAHELRTPLAVAKANVEAMIDGVVEDRQAGLENVRLEVERLIGLVEGIEDITKAEASFFTRNKYTEVDLRVFLDTFVAKMRPLAAEKGLYLELESVGELKIATDLEKLERILLNILTNALKNTPSGGVKVSYGTGDRMFFMEVRDTGVGIPQEIQELIFKRFFRGDDSSGIGLGLAIVQELAGVLGGRIELQSRAGEGSVFTVWLPLQGK